MGGKTFSSQPANRALADGGRVLVVYDVSPDEREALVAQEPEAFFFTDHFRDYPAVLVRLAETTPDRLRPYLERSWRRRAPKRLLKASGG